MGRNLLSENNMDIDEELPEITIVSSKNINQTVEEEAESSETESDSGKESENRNKKKQEGINWTAYAFSWQDFVPAVYGALFLVDPSEIPSFLSLVSDVSDFLPDGALFFNFVFDWWFTEPLHPDEDSVKVVELKYPCTKCDLKFQFDWEVPKHYLEVHLASAPPRPKPPEPVKEPSPPKPVKEPSPKPREPTPEIYVEPYPPLEDWCWQDFLPSWSEYFLPTGDLVEYDNSDIEDDDPDPEPELKEPTPPTPPVVKALPPAPPVRPPIPAPVIKQSKFECRTCSKTICNSCFTKKCGTHNVEFKGTAKFACGLC